jgi:hypothetical protein
MMSRNFLKGRLRLYAVAVVIRPGDPAHQQKNPGAWSEYRPQFDYWQNPADDRTQ